MSKAKAACTQPSRARDVDVDCSGGRVASNVPLLCCLEKDVGEGGIATGAAVTQNMQGPHTSGSLD